MSYIRTLILTIAILLGLNATLYAQQRQILKRDNADEYYDEAVKQAKLRNYTTAIGLCREGLRLRENFMDMHLLIGKLYTLTRAYDSARFHIKHVITHDPRYKDAYFYAINIEASTNHYEEALCYSDDALYFFPNDKELLLKKLSLLEQTKRLQQAIILADRIMDRFPSDSRAVLAYVEHKLVLGRYYMQRGSITQARLHFENALAADPSNREAINSLYNIEIRSGNYQAALNRVNFALVRNPNSYDLLMSKLSILQQMHAYAEAIDALRVILRYYPSDLKANRIETELRFDAARYYMAMDPIMQYQAIMEKQPGNREALNRLIGIHSGRGNYKEAMAWVNRGLRVYPDDEILLGQKLDLLEYDRKFTEGSAIAERLYRRSPTLAWRNRVVELKIASAQYYASQQIYDTALIEINKALQLSPNHYQALEKKLNILLTQNQYEDAMAVVNLMLDLYPGDDKIILRKSSILDAIGNKEEAAAMTSELLIREPDNKKYNAIYVEQRLSAARAYLQQDELEMAREQLRYVMDVAPSNMDALNYLINIESATQRYDSALYYSNQALLYKPGNKELLLKKASVLEAMKLPRESYAITGDLMKRYPYNNKIKDAYVGQVINSGRDYARRFVYDSALLEYRKALDVAPRDSLALIYSINLFSDKGLYDTALSLINQGLSYYPGSEYFHLKKAVVYEQMKNYPPAAAYADTASKINPSAKNLDYAAYLKSLSFKRQFGIFFLRSSFDDPARKANIATIEYRRFNKRGSTAFRMNYAGRNIGTGYQLDAETYYNHNATNYSYGVVSFSDGNVFPTLRLTYSLFHSFKKWEGEIGARYIRTRLDGTVLSFVGSGSKYFGDFWSNLRAFNIFQNGQSFQSYNWTTRYYMNDQSDYVQLFFGLGTTPDDLSRNYEIGSVLDFVTTTIGTAYMKTISYRNRVLFSATWINQKVADGVFRNQYDIYMQFQRRF